LALSGYVIVFLAECLASFMQHFFCGTVQFQLLVYKTLLLNELSIVAFALPVAKLCLLDHFVDVDLILLLYSLK